MEEIREEFERYVDELHATLRAGSLTGTDGERAQLSAERLIEDYRARLVAEKDPSRGREILERFREEAARL